MNFEWQEVLRWPSAKSARESRCAGPREVLVGAPAVTYLVRTMAA